jgi:putative Holliday junction resolvase
LIALLGVEDLVVVRAGDAVLGRKDKAQDEVDRRAPEGLIRSSVEATVPRSASSDPPFARIPNVRAIKFGPQLGSDRVNTSSNGGVLARSRHEAHRFATDALHIATYALDTPTPATANRYRSTSPAGDERTITTFLVGYPYNMDGTRGGRARDVDAFVTRLRAKFPGIEVVLHDERLTTKAADELLIESGHTGADRKSRRDSWSALVLLRDWLESTR